MADSLTLVGTEGRVAVLNRFTALGIPVTEAEG